MRVAGSLGGEDYGLYEGGLLVGWHGCGFWRLKGYWDIGFLGM